MYYCCTLRSIKRQHGLKLGCKCRIQARCRCIHRPCPMHRRRLLHLASTHRTHTSLTHGVDRRQSLPSRRLTLRLFTIHCSVNVIVTGRHIGEEVQGAGGFRTGPLHLKPHRGDVGDKELEAGENGDGGGEKGAEGESGKFASGQGANGVKSIQPQVDERQKQPLGCIWSTMAATSCVLEAQLMKWYIFKQGSNMTTKKCYTTILACYPTLGWRGICGEGHVRRGISTQPHKRCRVVDQHPSQHPQCCCYHHA
jgi:hypothetical protein